MDKYLPNIKVAFIGNMNNNHFAIMRYFKDFGIECHLFLLDNLPTHFSPHNDTWDVEKFNKSITKLNIGWPYKDFLKKKYKLKLEGFDIYIGCGLSPYYFQKAGKKLDIFLPYGSDLYELPFKSSFTLTDIKNNLKSLIHNLFVYKMQRQGILNSSKIFTINHIAIISDALKKLQKESLPLSTPMVYLEKSVNNIDFRKYVNENEVKKFNFRIFSHSRQFWGDTLRLETKGNNKLIKGFANFAKRIDDVCLILFEYGPSVDNSKNLVKKLGIENKVIWVKKMPRKYIYAFIKLYVHLGADQFDTGYFGASCYELMAHGIPTMNYLKDDEITFQQKTNRPIPPVLNVSDEKEISDAIQKIHSSKEFKEKMGKNAKEYFDKYLGIDKKKKYLEVILELYRKKKN